MRIRALHIQHFRTFTDFWFLPNDGVNVIVGPNNVGKTAMLEAIRLALDSTIRFGFDEVITRFDFHDQDLGKPVHICVWLAHDEHETEDVKLEYYDKLTKWQVADAPAPVRPLKAEPMTIPSDLPNHEELVCIRVSAEWDSSAGGAVVEHAVVDEEGTARWRLSPRQRRLIDYRYFGSRRDPVRELSLSPRSSLARNLDEKELLQAFSELLETLERQRDSLLNLESMKSLIARLEGLLSRDVLNTVVNEDASGFTVTFLQEGLTQLRRAATIATTRSPAGSAQATGLPLSYQGHGMQNLLLLAYIADALKGSRGACIVSFEEPEQNLEPPAARWIFRELIRTIAPSAPEGVANSGAGSALAGQCFITTHSPVLVSETDGAKHLVIMQRRPATAALSVEARDQRVGRQGGDSSGDAGAITAVACSRLEPAVRKALERNSALYANAVFARHVLLVDGASEVGCLPLAFRYFAGGSPGQDPFHLGLEIINVEGTGNVCAHARTLSVIGKSCHILLDRDCPADSREMQERIKCATQAADYVSCWSEGPLLPFVDTCDLEVVLAAQVAPAVLLEAIAGAYEDRDHGLNQEHWQRALALVADERVRNVLPKVFPADLRGWSLEELCCGEPLHPGKCNDPRWRRQNCGDLKCQRAFVFAALHGPHDCKSPKDMRMIAEHCAAAGEVPALIDRLRERVISAMGQLRGTEAADVYLAA